MPNIDVDAPGTVQLLLGNEAIARGALEAGIGFATAYPGTPSSEIIGSLAPIAKKMGIYVEWSVNERVAVEAAAGACFSGIRAMTAMKYNGTNVASDSIALISPCDTGKGGLVLVSADDPAGISSDNEQDGRNIAKMLEIPVLEPSSPQEAKDMTKWLFDLSEELRKICMLRTLTRVSHTSGNVELGKLPKVERKAYFDEVCDLRNATLTRYNPNFPSVKHPISLQKLDKAREKFESSPFNAYTGPDKADLLIITCGTCWLYSQEAVRALGLEDKVGILKVGTVWPLPEKFVEKHLSKSDKILMVEDMDPFLEGNVMELVANLPPTSPRPVFYGKRSGHISICGEQTPDTVIGALTRIMGLTYQSRDIEYSKEAVRIPGHYTAERGWVMCPGCPHRATFWTIMTALRLDGREGFCTGDIGCNQLGMLSSGYFQLRSVQSMGSSVGVASGLGKLGQFAFDQPVIAVCGDSTFYHAAIQGLINAVWNQSNFILVIADNNATAMTGFQPHPGTGMSAMGEPAKVVSMEAMCRSMGLHVEICDPFDLKKNTDMLVEMMAEDGVQVVIMRRMCELIRAREEKKQQHRMHVAPDKCLGDDCGCGKLCVAEFRCPGLVWNRETAKAEIDEALCSGCGVCADICQRGAIIKEEL